MHMVTPVTSNGACVPQWKVLCLGCILLLGLMLSGTRAFAIANFNFTKLYQCDPLGVSAYSDVWGDGNYAYMGTINPSYGVHIFDITQPDCTLGVSYAAYNPSIGIDPTTGEEIKLSFPDIQVKNGYGYFGSGAGAGSPSDGIHIVNVSDPMNPVMVSKINSTTHLGSFDDVHNLFVDAGVLYVVDAHSNTVKVYDVGVNTTPQAPRYLCEIITSGNGVHDITVRSNRLYVSMLTGNTDIYDVTGVRQQTPSCPSYLQPGKIASFYTGNYTHSSWPSADGKILAVAQEFQSAEHVSIWDVSGATPTRISTIYGPDFGIPRGGGGPHNPVMVNDLLFVSWYKAGVLVFDLADPRHPSLIGSYDTNTATELYGNWGVYPFLGPGSILASDVWTGMFALSFDCSKAVQFRQVESLGNGSANNDQIKVTFTGCLTNSAAVARNPMTSVLYICPGTTLDFVATTTTGTLSCTINNNTALPYGTLRANDSLHCHNKPGGGDVDKFYVRAQ